MKFKDKLKKQRALANLSQETLAEKLQVSRQTISKWENGSSLPSTKHIFALAEIFNCSINDLITPPTTSKPKNSKSSSKPSSSPLSKTLSKISPKHYLYLLTGTLVLLILSFSLSLLSLQSINNSKINTQKLAVFNKLLDSSLETIANNPALNSFTNKKIVGFGYAEPDGTFYIKCALSSDGSNTPCSAIIYFCEENNGYSYKCQLLDDPNYLPKGKYYELS